MTVTVNNRTKNVIINNDTKVVTVTNETSTVSISQVGVQGSPGLSWIDEGWSIGLQVPLRGAVERNGSSYRAIEAHIASSNNEPGVGADWEDVWVVIALRGNLTDEFNEALETAIEKAEEATVAANSSVSASAASVAAANSATASAASALASANTASSASNTAVLAANSASSSATSAANSASQAAIAANVASSVTLASARHEYTSDGSDVGEGGYQLAVSTGHAGTLDRFYVSCLGGNTGGFVSVELEINGSAVTPTINVSVGSSNSYSLGSLQVTPNSSIIVNILSVIGISNIWMQVD